MSKPANKTMIGAFVVGGVALCIASVLIFGSGKFLTHTFKYDIYFQGSVTGLQVGSPVIFRGVKIGEVTEITLYLNLKDLSIVMPVEIEVDPAKFKTIGGVVGDRNARLKPLIEKGLRAQLQMQSMVTGQLMVYLDLYPTSPIVLLGSSDSAYPEIPAIPSDSQELMHSIEQLPLKDIAVKLDGAIGGVNRLMNSPVVYGSIDSAKKLLTDLDRLIAQNENLSLQTSQTLNEISRLAESLNSFAGYLSRHPEAMIRGKAPSKGE